MASAGPTPLNSDLAAEPRGSDAAVVDLLRMRESLEVGELADALGVTATAVRQRLERLMKAGLVERTAVAKPRGRPSHAYSLTDAGRKLGGDNFRDLALVLWREIRSIRDPQVRSGLIGRIGASLAEAYRSRLRGVMPAERLASVASLMQERDICCSVERSAADGGLPVLTSHACPYPDLAEEDRGICAAERVMLQELVGTSVRLADCRLDGGSSAGLSPGSRATGRRMAGLAHPPVNASNAERFPDLTHRTKRKTSQPPRSGEPTQ